MWEVEVQEAVTILQALLAVIRLLFLKLQQAVVLVGSTEDLAAAVVAQEVALEQWTQLNQDFLHLADQETHHQLAHHKETMAVLQI